MSSSCLLEHRAIRLATLGGNTASWFVALLAVGIAFASTFGCKQNPRVVPVSGTVLYNDKPLPFGTVLFQPTNGQVASGQIERDGSFKLSSYADNDGAVPGRHFVSVTCYEGQRPGAAAAPKGGEVSMGKLLIPVKYTRFGSSGLSAEIQDATDQAVELRLEGPPVKF